MSVQGWEATKFFGGLFTAYIAYRYSHPAAFVAASHELDITLGGINTAVLIGSSLTMVLAVSAAQAGLRKGIKADSARLLL